MPGLPFFMLKAPRSLPDARARKAPVALPLPATGECRRIPSDELFAGADELEILHDGETYVLRQVPGGGLQLSLR